MGQKSDSRAEDKDTTTGWGQMVAKGVGVGVVMAAANEPILREDATTDNGKKTKNKQKTPKSLSSRLCHQASCMHTVCSGPAFLPLF